MIHRVVFGSMERFIGILIEHYAGLFPVVGAGAGTGDPGGTGVLPYSQEVASKLLTPVLRWKWMNETRR